MNKRDKERLQLVEIEIDNAKETARSLIEINKYEEIERQILSEFVYGLICWIE